MQFMKWPVQVQSKWRPIHWQVQCKQRPIHLLWTWWKSQNVELQSVFFLHVTFWFFLQGLYYNFELFRIREKQIPVDKVEVKGKLIYYPRRFILLFFLLKLFLCESSWLSFCRKCDCICLGACWQSICIYTWRIPQDFSFILPDQTRESGNYQ